MYIAVISAFEIAKNSVDEKKFERYELLMERCITFANLFPESKRFNEINAIRKEAELYVSTNKKE
jgi:hypothetical protein